VHCELGPAQCYSPDPLKMVAPDVHSDRASVATVPPLSGRSCRTAPCHLLLPASTRSPRSTASMCATPVTLIRCKPSSRSKGCFLLFSLHASLCSLLHVHAAPIGRESPCSEHHCCCTWRAWGLPLNCVSLNPTQSHHEDRGSQHHPPFSLTREYLNVDCKCLATTDPTASAKTSARPPPTPCRFRASQVELRHHRLLR
jgi:hypothetical protein